MACCHKYVCWIANNIKINLMCYECCSVEFWLGQWRSAVDTSDKQIKTDQDSIDCLKNCTKPRQFIHYNSQNFGAKLHHDHTGNIRNIRDNKEREKQYMNSKFFKLNVFLKEGFLATVEFITEILTLKPLYSKQILEEKLWLY